MFEKVKNTAGCAVIYFYEIGKEKSFNSVCFYSDDFLNLVRRYFYFKGDERGKKAKNGKKYETKIFSNKVVKNEVI